MHGYIRLIYIIPPPPLIYDCKTQQASLTQCCPLEVWCESAVLGRLISIWNIIFTSGTMWSSILSKTAHGKGRRKSYMAFCKGIMVFWEVSTALLKFNWVIHILFWWLCLMGHGWTLDVWSCFNMKGKTVNEWNKCSLENVYLNWKWLFTSIC